MSPPPGVILFAVRLMWSVLPFGLLVTAANALAVHRTAERPATARPGAVPSALEFLDTWAWGRTAAIAAGFCVAAVIYGFLARTVRRGPRGHPAAVMVLSGVFAVAFGLGCLWVWETMPLAAPSWYRPVLAGLLGAAAGAQLLAVVLLTRTRAGVWVSRLGMGGRDDPDAVDAGTRRAARLLVGALGFVAAYAAVTAAAVQLAAAANTDGHNDLLSSVHATNLMVSGFIALWTLPFAVHGMVLLRRHARRAKPLALASTGGFSVLYLLLFWYLSENNAATSFFFFDDQSMLTSHVPDWHVPVLYGIVGIAAVAQLTALVTLARRPLPF
ncbi:MAG: hypothetical protein GEV11_15900 [Streptosporangiales bacterium]|nr:hypothetical protein [Streptosporangiales bacterium]